MMTLSRYVKTSEEAETVRKFRTGYVAKYGTFLAKVAKLKTDSVILDVPCGAGGLSGFLSKKIPKGKLICLDINQHMIEKTEETVKFRKLNLIRGDATYMSELVKTKVDVIFCINGFHQYIERQLAFLRACEKVLKPGGRLIIDISTRGLTDKTTRDYLASRRKIIERLVEKTGTHFGLPEWPNRNTIKKYIEMLDMCGLLYETQFQFDEWKSTEKSLEDSLSIPGRSEPWMPGLEFEKRAKILRKASRLADRKFNLEQMEYNRVFLIIRKPKTKIPKGDQEFPKNYVPKISYFEDNEKKEKDEIKGRIKKSQKLAQYAIILDKIKRNKLLKKIDAKKQLRNLSVIEIEEIQWVLNQYGIYSPAAVSEFYAQLSNMKNRIRKPKKIRIAALKNALRNKNSNIRHSAASELSKARLGKEVIPLIIETLGDGDRYVREMAGYQTMDIVKEKEVELIINELRKALRTGNELTKDGAAFALFVMKHKAVKAIPELKIALKYEKESIRFSAAWSLGEIGRDIEDVIEALNSVRKKDSSRRVKKRASESIRNILEKNEMEERS